MRTQGLLRYAKMQGVTNKRYFLYQTIQNKTLILNDLFIRIIEENYAHISNNQSLR
jgi:hypothetical protein